MPTPKDPAFVKLISRLVAAEPNSGYQSAQQIGPLSGVELATVLRHEPCLLVDAADSVALIESVAATLSDEAFNAIENAALIGAGLIGALTTQTRTYLLAEVRAEIARDEERMRLGAADERANRAMGFRVETFG